MAEERQHALLSASGAHRWMACTPSARLESEFPDSSSEAAAEGTLAHEVAELKARHYFFTTECTRRKFSTAYNKLKKEPLWDDEMDEHTETYLDFLKSVGLGFDSTPYVALEKRVDFSTYVPDGFGTADCIMISGGTIHIIDFKYGKGVPVSADRNPQLSLYALGAYATYCFLYPIKTIRMSIVQPRLTDGNSTWECSTEELLAFGQYAKERATLALEGGGPFAPGDKTCRFCRARQLCRARSDHNVKQAFGIGELPPLITSEEVGERLKKLTDIVKYQSDLQDWALSQCLAGGQVPGWKAVEGRSSRVWADMDAAFGKLQEKGIQEAVLYERKALTLAQVEKVIGKKDFDTYVGSMVIRKPGKPALVPESDKREAITNKVTASEAFKDNE